MLLVLAYDGVSAPCPEPPVSPPIVQISTVSYLRSQRKIAEEIKKRRRVNIVAGGKQTYPGDMAMRGCRSQSGARSSGLPNVRL